MFAGTGGFGVKDMPSAHSRVMSKKCVTCHMHREEKDKLLEKGGHTFRADDGVCLECHEDSKSLMGKWEQEISPLLKQLKTLLDSDIDKKSRYYKAARLNYNIIIADGGVGSHNPKYAKALLQYSISSLSVD